MSKCAELFRKHARVARAISRNVYGEWHETSGSETSYAHYCAWYLASQLIAGTYVA